MEKEEKMITKLTAVTEFWTYHYITIIDNNEIVFVEVKTRATDFFCSPEEAVTIPKQQHLIEGANYYLEQNEIDLNARFDVIAIVMSEKKIVINHIKDAFSAF